MMMIKFFIQKNSPRLQIKSLIGIGFLLQIAPRDHS
jgi:hypothetical protein